MTAHGKARLALAIVCFFWGTTYFAIRFAVAEMHPALFCAVRFFIGGAPLLLYALWRGDRFPRGREWWHLLIISVMLLTVGNGTLAWAEQWVPTGIASLIVVTTPLWMAVFARLAGEDVHARAVMGLCVGFLGLAILAWPDVRGARLDSGFMKGALGLVLSSISWAAGSVYSKRRPRRYGAVMALALEMLISGVILGAISVYSGHVAFWTAGWRCWLAIGYLVLFGSILGYGCYIYALERLPTVQVSIYAYVNPIVAVLLGVVFLGERFDYFLAAGIPLMLLGVFLVNSDRPRRKILPGIAEPGGINTPS